LLRAKQEETVLKFKMPSLAGEEVDLAKYQGQVVMIVNVASKCGYTGQYEQLQKLHEKYAIQGLAILARLYKLQRPVSHNPWSGTRLRHALGIP
jgi:glutathione peroxidase-family protein